MSTAANKKMSNTSTCKVAALEFDRIWRRYEDIVHQGSCTLEFKSFS